MKLAIVHDWFLHLGGADRVLVALHRIFPDAPIYTLFADQQSVSRYLPNANVRTSFLQRIPLITRLYQKMALLMPAAVESFDLSGYDTVISSSPAFAKGIVTNPKTRHICYCYSPTRQLWDNAASYTDEISNLQFPISKQNSAASYKLQITDMRLPTRFSQHFLRLWDRQAADRVDEFIAISEHVRSRIRKYYQRDARVIYPPVPNLHETRNMQHVTKEKMLHAAYFMPQDYYLLVSRLYRYKNVDVAVDAFNKLGYPLVIIGDGPDRRRLQKLAGRNIMFTGRVSDERLAWYYENCRAFIMPQEEDFGLTPVEAMQFGRPTVALRRGGALETITEGETGEFFDDPIPEALADGVRRLNEKYHVYRPIKIKAGADRFSSTVFEKNIRALVS